MGISHQAAARKAPLERLFRKRVAFWFGVDCLWPQRSVRGFEVCGVRLEFEILIQTISGSPQLQVNWGGPFLLGFGPLPLAPGILNIERSFDFLNSSRLELLAMHFSGDSAA